MDPLAKSYSMLTPYQFASNTPIMAVDLDGLEAANARAIMEKMIQGVENLEMNNISDGFGDIQEQHYVIHVSSPSNTVSDLKQKIVTDINSIYGTPSGSFRFEKQQVEGEINKGDFIGIRPFPKGFDIFVKVTDVQSFDNDLEGLNGFEHTGFSLKFRTLEGHVEVGVIEFKALKVTTPSGERSFEFSINSTTRVNSGVGHALNEMNDFARDAQRGVWHQVLNNIHDFIGGAVQNAKETIVTVPSTSFDEIKDNEQTLGSPDSGAVSKKETNEIEIDP